MWAPEGIFVCLFVCPSSLEVGVASHHQTSLGNVMICPSSHFHPVSSIVSLLQSSRVVFFGTQEEVVVLLPQQKPLVAGEPLPRSPVFTG